MDSIYGSKSLATQLALRKRLLRLKLQGDIPLIKHFTIFYYLIIELLSAGAKLEKTDKVSHLLLTLPPAYDEAITAIETLSENNLTLAFIKTKLWDHEIKLRHESSDTSSKVLHAGKTDDFIYKITIPEFKKSWKNNNRQGQGKLSQNKQINVKFQHCGRKGHMKKNCFH